MHWCCYALLLCIVVAVMCCNVVFPLANVIINVALFCFIVVMHLCFLHLCLYAFMLLFIYVIIHLCCYVLMLLCIVVVYCCCVLLVCVVVLYCCCFAKLQSCISSYCSCHDAVPFLLLLLCSLISLTNYLF